MASLKVIQAEKESSSDQHAEFKKNNEVISVQVSQGRMTLMSRKIFNALVCFAQKVGKPGVGAPIKTETAKQYFWMPMADLIRDTAYNSNDTELIKQCVEELSNIKIQMEDDREWTSERLISSVKIVNPAGLRARGGQVFFGFAFPPEVFEHVMRPGKYTQLSLYYQTMIRSGTSMSLYEVCRQYATNPSHVTVRKPWLWWYHTLSGNPVNENAAPEYKYFKRDVLKHAVTEVNAITDVEVELIEHKVGRRVVDLQFKVGFKPQQSFDFSPPIVDGQLIAQITEFGISLSEATEICAAFPEDYLRATLDYVGQRISSKTASKIDSPAAYFKTALKNRYVSSIEIAARASNVVPKRNLKKKVLVQEEEDPITVAFNRERKARAIGYFNELDADEQQTYLSRFMAVAPSHIIAMLRKDNLKSKIAEVAFAEWLAHDLWGVSTAEEMLDFAKKRAVESTVV